MQPMHNVFIGAALGASTAETFSACAPPTDKEIFIACS
jgi:hypothetical protein